MNGDTKTSMTDAVSIDAVLNKLHHWRANKSSYPETGIPETIWRMIFALEDAGHRPTSLRSLFSLNSGQYARKREQLCPKASARANQPSLAPAKVNETLSPAAFSEVSVVSTAPPQSDIPSLTQAASQNRQAVKQLRSTESSPEHYLDTTTIIVECIRPDGHRLKIHTTNNRLDTIMQVFFSRESIPC